MTREIETWLSDSKVGNNSVVDHTVTPVRRRHKGQEAQLSPRDRAMRRVNRNLANCHATVQTTYTTSPDQIDGMKLEI